MTTALAIRNDMDIQTLGTTLAKSGYFLDSKDAAQAIVKVLAGAELGIAPIASMTGIFIVKQRVTLSANLIAAVIKRAKPHYDYRIREHTDTVCSIEFFEERESVGMSTFTRDDARKAGTQNMDKFPRNMLFARAISNGAKWFTPELFGGGSVYTPEEMGATVDGDTGEIIDVAPVAATRTIPRQGTALPRAAIQQEDPDEKREIIATHIQPLNRQYQALTGESFLDRLDLMAIPIAELRTLYKTIYGAVEDVKADLAEAEAITHPVPEAAEPTLVETEAVAA